MSIRTYICPESILHAWILQMVQILVFDLLLWIFFQYYCLLDFNWLILIWFGDWILSAATSATASTATTMAVTTIACITSQAGMITTDTTAISWYWAWTIARSHSYISTSTAHYSDSLRYSVTITIFSSYLIYIIFIFSRWSLNHLNPSSWTNVM
jgi:hypothetical protein